MTPTENSVGGKERFLPLRHPCRREISTTTITKSSVIQTLAKHNLRKSRVKVYWDVHFNTTRKAKHSKVALYGWLALVFPHNSYEERKRTFYSVG